MNIAALDLGFRLHVGLKGDSAAPVGGAADPNDAGPAIRTFPVLQGCTKNQQKS